MLTPDQIEHYREQGYVLVSGLFTDEHLDELEQSFDAIIEARLRNRAGLDATWGGEKWKERYGYKTDTVILHTHDVQAYSASWTKALTHDPLTEAISDAMGCPNVQLHHTKGFQKPAEKGSGFPMHQDQPYFPHANDTMTAAVIYLSDATEEMGCIKVYPGSHKLGPLEPWENKHLNPDDYPIEGATACPAKRGDVLLFNYLTIHGSDINRSDKTRKSVLLQVRDPEDPPLIDTHRSHAQGMMLRGINPLSQGQKTADFTLGSERKEVAPETERLTAKQN